MTFVQRYSRCIGAVARRVPPFRGKARIARLLVPERYRLAPQTLRLADGVFRVPNVVHSIAFDLWVNGNYEAETLRCLSAIAAPDATIIDVGANIGALAIPLAQKLPKARVVAIEPSSAMVQILQENIALNLLRNVTVIRCLATDRDGPATFYEAPPTHFGMGSCAPRFHGTGKVTVTGRKLDGLLAELRIDRPDAIKIDVEGYEAAVLGGAAALLASAHPPAIIFEFNDWAESYACSGHIGRAQEILFRYGYKLWRLSDHLAGRSALSEPLRAGSDMLFAARPH
jgi:FkbM family methyltransferase